MSSLAGVAVTFVFFITDILFALVLAVVWDVHWFFPAAFLIFFGSLDGVYLSATLNKVCPPSTGSTSTMTDSECAWLFPTGSVPLVMA